MTGTLVVLSCLLSASPYSAAREDALNSGRPLVILVSADWCPHCVTMKRSVMPQIAGTGAEKDVVYTTVNTDEHPQLARQLMNGTSLPQLVMYSKSPNGNGWQRQRLIGAQSVGSVRSFIRRGLN